MGWYDLFSKFYDTSLEPLYVDARARAAEALSLEPGSVVLDAPCGTGLSFDVIAPIVAGHGALVGVDASRGMLAKANSRVRKRGWRGVHTLQADLVRLTSTDLQSCGAPTSFDRALIFLGMTAFEQPAETFDRVWSLLSPGGVCVVVDVFAERPSFQGKLVNLVARADISRRAWEPLERASTQFSRVGIPSLPQHGGQLYLARGVKGGRTQ